MSVAHTGSHGDAPRPDPDLPDLDLVGDLEPEVSAGSDADLGGGGGGWPRTAGQRGSARKPHAGAGHTGNFFLPL